jgi:hypothetical protein
VALLVLTVSALAFVALRVRPQEKAPAEAQAAFDLDLLLSATQCQLSLRQEDASRRAALLEQMAAARMQRAVFVPSEAVRATALLAEAEQCLRLASASDVERVHAQWLRWKEDLSSRFHGHRLRLDLALKNQRSADALDEIVALKALLDGLPTGASDSPLSKLMTWLDFEQRRIAATAENKRKGDHG